MSPGLHLKAPEARTVRWGLVFLFLVVAFSLTWGTIFLANRASNGSSGPVTGLAPLGMFMPAAAALVLRLFVLRDSALYFRSYRELPRWIVLGFLLLVPLQMAVTALAYTTVLPPSLLRGISSWSMILWTLLIIRVYRRVGEESFRRGGLQLGNTSLGARFVAGFAVFLLLQSALNLAFGLSELRPRADQILGFSIPGGFYGVALVPLFLLSVIGTPLGGLAVVFGEEYAWRGFLQDELAPLGRLPASLLIGLIWGLWHIPIILSGIHTYPPNLGGIGLGLVFFSLWGLILSYAVFKTGSVWTAAFLHGVVNGAYSFLRTYVERPADRVFSFGLGVFGLVCLALVVLVILRDPTWRGAGGESRPAGPASLEEREPFSTLA